MLTYVFLMAGILIVGFPIIYALIAATHTIETVSMVPMPLIPSDQFWVNMQSAWDKGDLGTQLMNSFIMAAGITIGKICVSLLGAFSIVYFDYRLRIVAFVAVFCTLMLPVEVRILPTYEMAANLFGPLQMVWDFLHLDGIVAWFIGHDIQLSNILQKYSSGCGTCLISYRIIAVSVLYTSPTGCWIWLQKPTTNACITNNIKSGILNPDDWLVQQS